MPAFPLSLFAGSLFVPVSWCSGAWSLASFVSCVGLFPGLWAVAEFVGRTGALVFFILLCFPLRYRYAVFTSDGGVLQAALEGSQLDIIEIVVPEFDVCRDLSMFLMMNLIEGGYSFTANAEKEIVPVVKEKPCYVCLDFGTEHKSLAQVDKENVYVVLDGNIITVATNVSVARNCCS